MFGWLVLTLFGCFAGPMSKLYPGPAAEIPGTGPAPFLMRAEDWKRVSFNLCVAVLPLFGSAGRNGCRAH